jgi:hypothetical protein
MPRAKAAPALPAAAAMAAQSVYRMALPPAPIAVQPPHQWISPAQAAATLGVTIEALKKRAKQGKIGFKEGARWRFSLADCLRYMERIENRYLKTCPRQ